MRLLSLFFFIGVMALGVLAPAPTEARTIGERAREERAGPGAAAQRRPYFLWLSTPSLLTRADARADAAELAWRERNAALIEANAAGTGPVLEAPRRAAFVMANRQAQADLAAWRLERDRLQQAVSRRLGRPVRFGLEAAVAGSVVTTGLTPSEAAQLGGLPGLRAVTPVQPYTLIDEAAARLVQSPGLSTGTTVWDGRATGLPAQGEGMVVAVLDTGIRPAHNAFATTHRDGYVQPAPRRGGLGLCANDATLGCNAKVLGIYDYTGRGLNSDGSLPPIPSAAKGIDSDGHGTGMAAHVVGSRVEGTGFLGPVSFSGVAPRAAVVSYQVCGPGLHCRDDWIVAALDQAVRDGANVVNMSFSGGDAPLTGLPAIPFWDARDAGIVIVSGSGNRGPAPGVGNPCTGITVLCVGNSTTDRATTNGFPVGGFDAVQADVLRQTSSRGPGTASIGLVKPDVVAPGTNVFTPTFSSTEGYFFTSGGGASTATAMASGAAALLRQLRPSWNAAATSSALSTSARPSVRLESGLAATPFEAGAGRVQVENAALQG
ncbi:MAG: S8 family serine peptidase, partial [Lysobacteraceae bacterium]